MRHVTALVVGVTIGMLSMYAVTPHEQKVEEHPYDRCVQLLGKYVTPNVNPVQVEMLMDGCLKKRERVNK
jgi:hypothetical protein